MQDLPSAGAPGTSVRARLAANLKAVRDRIEAAAARSHRAPGSARLLVVTKTVGAAIIDEMAALGVADIGENRVQDAVEKALRVRSRVRWHLIGHLQTNKAKKALGLFSTVHSVDSLRVAQALSAQATARARATPLPIFLEVNVSGEKSKGGFTPEAVREALPQIVALPSIAVTGLMTMPPIAEDPEASRPFFRALRELRDSLSGIAPLPELSMGMTQDFEVAVEEGATWVRVGTALYEGLGGVA
jgi:pyridoxal phosphate enzyme (YggS family)